MISEHRHGPLKTCEECDGTGKDTRKRTRDCPTCKGRGLGNICSICDSPAEAEPGILDGPIKCKCVVCSREGCSALVAQTEYYACDGGCGGYFCDAHQIFYGLDDAGERTHQCRDCVKKNSNGVRDYPEG